MGAKRTLYKVPGKFRLKSGLTYGVLDVFDQRSMENSIARGWHPTLEAAVAASNGITPKEAPQAAAIVEAEAPVVDTVPEDNAPPTREELEEKARELGVKFDGRTGDKLLLRRINEALEG
jgi:hypothetical protein